MHIRIEYCNSWGYRPRALQLEAKIRKEFPGTDFELVRSSGGVFEISKDGVLIYSKRATGMHPRWEDVVEKLR